MAGPFGDLADGWEENQTLVGGVLFFLCLLLQIPSYCFSRPVQEKSVPFFAARCMSYCFYREILICGDCAVAAPFKMPSNIQTAAEEYENDPPSEYYKDGYNLYRRMAEYRHNHLLFLSNPLVEPDNNLCERKARILKGKINQVISLRSFEQLTYFCECLSVLDHFASGSMDNLYRSVKDVFERPRPVMSGSECSGSADTIPSECKAG